MKRFLLVLLVVDVLWYIGSLAAAGLAFTSGVWLTNLMGAFAMSVVIGTMIAVYTAFFQEEAETQTSVEEGGLPRLTLEVAAVTQGDADAKQTQTGWPYC